MFVVESDDLAGESIIEETLDGHHTAQLEQLSNKNYHSLYTATVTDVPYDPLMRHFYKQKTSWEIKLPTNGGSTVRNSNWRSIMRKVDSAMCTNSDEDTISHTKIHWSQGKTTEEIITAAEVEAAKAQLVTQRNLDTFKKNRLEIDKVDLKTKISALTGKIIG